MEFNLNKTPFHVLMATGPVSNGAISYHTGGRFISKDAYGKRKTSKDLTIPIFAVFLLTDFTRYNKHLFDVYDECNKEKGCFGDSADCVSGKNCTFLTTFYGDSKASYTFEIYGKLKKGFEYVASAMSFDTAMGNDSVVACILNSDKNSVEAKMYWNEGRTSKPLDVSLHFHDHEGIITIILFPGPTFWNYPDKNRI